MPLAVVVNRISIVGRAGVHTQYAQAISDRDTRCDQQKVVCIFGVVAILISVEVMVQNQTRHHNSFARTSRHFESHPGQNAGSILHCFVCKSQLFQDVGACIGFVSYLVEPNSSFYSFLLGEKEFFPIRSAGVLEPEFEQILCHPARDLWIPLVAPLSDLFT